ncbi:MAG: aminoacetone oxidase family FAD-binding enzyme, partial [Campylobacter sp.]|nr:aminoacetone oxidase family FAD-binding enzyme [Campylobacter sp.]
YLGNFGIIDKPLCKFSDDEFEFVKRLQSYKFAPAGNFGYSKAEITKGGINVSEIGTDAQSKLSSRLYFIGEILDVSGMIGGYNLHFAFASAKSIINSKILENLD